MKKLVILLLVSSCLLSVSTFGYAAQRGAYVPGELLVKYKPSVSATASERYKTWFNISTKRTFEKIGVKHVKLPEDMTVQEALEIYQNDPDVEYAEPNYYWYITATPNDSSFDLLWGLHNTGQTVNETSGTADADIDAVEAWDITTGSSDVVVAVIDSGVDYNHPDLSANIWTNTGEIADNDFDDDGNGYKDDVRGWDFVDGVDGDNDPIDSTNHGTHVAGIIGAVGNNSIGVTGVNWTVKIMPLRVGNDYGVVSDITAAIQYASEMGAHVINLSLGGADESQTVKAAIDASSAVVVCAAGNDGTDNDTSPLYPASYDSPNIIAVAATDQNDELASFSNFGVTSVDVAAPGTNIYSTIPARQTVWSDDFDDGDISDWTTGGTNNTWGITSALSYSSPYSLTDSPGSDYLNDTDSWAIAPVINLSSYSGAKLEFQLNGESESDTDFLYVQVSTDLSDWTYQYILINDEFYYDGVNGISGTLNGKATVDLGAYDGNSTVYIRFRFTSYSTNTEDGWYIDDVKVTAASSTYDGMEYEYMQGTSMAAPFVSGVAALLKAQDSSLTHTEIKAMIENAVDAKPSLSNKIATGGRVNAFNALGGFSAPSSLNATAVSTSRIDLTWTDNSSNESGFEIERKTGSDGTYSRIATVASNTISYSDTGLEAFVIYYYRVRAYNSEKNTEYSNEANATTFTFSVGGGGGGCFIATAAYGSLLEPHVKILRDFRDRFLISNSIGKAFVNFYYTCSPPLAEFIANHDSLRAMVRLSLLPVVGVSWVILRFGLISTLVFMIIFVTGTLKFLIFRNKIIR